MAYTISPLMVKNRVAGVTSVVVTDVAHDEVAGDYWREVRVFAQGDVEGAIDEVVLTLQVRGATADAVMVATPTFTF